MTTAPHVPAPPQGPGVHPPFPAPPVEGRGRRLGRSLGIAAGVVVLVCGGGVAALAGLVSNMNGAITEQAQAAVTAYLHAVQDKKYDQAYGMLCDRTKARESAAEFRTQIEQEEPIEDFNLGDLNLVDSTMQVRATYAGGGSRLLEADLDQDTGTGAFEVCSVGE